MRVFLLAKCPGHRRDKLKPVLIIGRGLIYAFVCHVGCSKARNGHSRETAKGTLWANAWRATGAIYAWDWPVAAKQVRRDNPVRVLHSQSHNTMLNSDKMGISAL